MTTGSSSALVLSTATQTGGEEDPGKRAYKLLLPFLDASIYSAVAVVHGLSPTASKAFDLAKQMLEDTRGVIWVTDQDLVAAITGPKAAKMRKALKPDGSNVLTFFSVLTGKSKWSVGWQRMTTGMIDELFLEAGLDQ